MHNTAAREHMLSGWDVSVTVLLAQHIITPKGPDDQDDPRHDLDKIMIQIISRCRSDPDLHQIVMIRS